MRYSIVDNISSCSGAPLPLGLQIRYSVEAWVLKLGSYLAKVESNVSRYSSAALAHLAADVIPLPKIIESRVR